MPAPGSHRSGRAELPHPAPRAMDSQNLNGYPFLFRADGAGAQCPRHLSLERVHGTASPSLHRVSHRPGFPGFNGTMGCSESLPPIPPHFVAFVWRYHMRAGSFAPVGCPARGLPQAGAHWSPGCPRVRGSHVETTGPPRFLGDPHARALLSDPDGTFAPGQCGASMLPSAFRTASAPAVSVLTGLNHTARAFAVYASQDGLLRHHARLASGCWPDFARRDWLPAGSQRKVSVCLTTSHPPSPGFPWRKRNEPICQVSL